ncbi:MAG: LysR substrate-binding domain-containing protein [Rubrivivax sp.]
MDFKQLEYFVRVAEHGSFSRAAGVLRVAQPALSRQVRSLETELRQHLFVRNGRGVTLTDAGRVLLAHGQGLLQQLERARTELEEHRGAPVGRLALGLPPSVGRTLTVPLVQAFRLRFPKATLAIVEGLSATLVEWLAQGRIDAAVVYPVAPSAAVELKPLLEEKLLLVTAAPARRRAAGPAAGASPRECRMAESVSLTELAARGLVIPSRPHSIRMAVETALAEAGLKPRVALEIESIAALLALVADDDSLAAVLAPNALRDLPPGPPLRAQPIRLGKGRATLGTRLFVATSSQRPAGPLLGQGLALLAEQMHGLWARPAG